MRCIIYEIFNKEIGLNYSQVVEYPRVFWGCVGFAEDQKRRVARCLEALTPRTARLWFREKSELSSRYVQRWDTWCLFRCNVTVICSNLFVIALALRVGNVREGACSRPREIVEDMWIIGRLLCSWMTNMFGTSEIRITLRQSASVYISGTIFLCKWDKKKSASPDFDGFWTLFGSSSEKTTSYLSWSIFIQ